ncbi:MAG: trypsin-like peptidase domain-containing protein [Planctomycetes bacterium]|nr:trypsin-like peptidase domain-containing protein [Planctomycetota bacterium]
MKRILGLVLGCALCVVGLVSWVLTQDAQRITQDAKEIVIVKAPSKEPRNPYQEEYEKMLYPTVRITAGFSTGSGVVISHTQTYILTAAHVVEDQSVVDVELYDFTNITATVVITDTDNDLALLRINRDCFADARNDIVVYSARLAPESYIAYLFTPIYTVGCSLGLKPRPSQGIISAVNTDSWEVSSPILPGNSGGPVYDARTYEVIGIAVWVKTYQGQLVTTMAGIVPINQIYQFLDTHSLRSVQADKHE